MMIDTDLLISGSETADLVGVTRQTIWNWLNLPKMKERYNFPEPVLEHHLTKIQFFNRKEVEEWKDRYEQAKKLLTD